MSLVSPRLGQTHVLPTLIWFISLLPFITSLSDPFFWDTIQFAGKQGLHFFENGFTALPMEIDSGHLPFLGIYQAWIWKLFGPELLVSHWSMLPFLALYARAVYLLSQKIDEGKSLYLYILFLVEPCFLTQSTLVSPDVLLLSGFAWCTYAFFTQQKVVPLCLGGFLLAFSGNRGSALILVFILAILFLRKSEKNWITGIMALMPSLAVFGWYQAWHYFNTSWIGYHEAMTWAPSFQKTGLIGMLKNVGLMIWRLMDTGRVAMILLLGYYVLIQKSERTSDKKRWILILILVSLVLAVLTIPYVGLMGHRYYLPLYFLCIIGLGLWIPTVLKGRLYAVAVLFFLTGHFWVYPEGIAMGWDSTLAYKPYQSQREKAIFYLKSEGISPAEVGSDFPNISGFRFTDLNLSDHSGFKSFDLEKDEYLLYSPVMNGMADFLPQIRNSYTESMRWQQGRLEMILFKKK